ncbi:MAG: UDP-N-acetylmuramoyl-L-alanyl-D-glutamate--2,6-diaminopimelate ligase [Chlorobi bacterium]|nr:UDP-N-acetylmuramoyl-L-alanyl-D-glutamate--2,6-diaminopimelate ligase [Chlorobiota bacterium]
MRLNDIEKLKGFRKVVTHRMEHFSRVVADSRQVQKGDIFVAVRGTRADGHKYISQVMDKGAEGVVCEYLPEGLEIPVTTIMVENSGEFLGWLAALSFGNPSAQMKVIGITGTNGKTTIATSLFNLFKAKEFTAGLISTTGIYVGNHSFSTVLTTPDALTLQKHLSLMQVNGVSHVFMEVSSHAAEQYRIAGITFAGGIFTNLSQDHLDYHKDMNAYLYAKKRFFDMIPSDGFVLINLDDRHAGVMVQNTSAKVKTYALKKIADFRPTVIEKQLDGTLVRFENKEIWIPFPGDFSVYNMTAVYAVAVMLGLNHEEIWKEISRLPQVPGRFEIIRSEKGPFAVVDYAHTPDALVNVLKTLHQVKSDKTKIFTVVGAGGNRDHSKRPRMARFAFDLSDQLILTSDNPRDEDPDDIIRDMLQGLEKNEQHNVICITDRAEAIKTGLRLADPGDIVLVAGKGHEAYQEINGVKHHFDDREFVRNYFADFKK